jgi:hypothetical protein
MSLLAGQISAVRTQERLAREGPAHRTLVAFFLDHSLLEEFPQQT